MTILRRLRSVLLSVVPETGQIRWKLPAMSTVMIAGVAGKSRLP